MTDMNRVATEVIRDRTIHKDTWQRPRHHRAARALRSLAERLERGR